MIQFTHSVGTAPGTTTMEAPGMNGLGVCPPGYYGDQIMLPGAINLGPSAGPNAGTLVTVDPYGTESTMKGLGAVQLLGLRGTGIRWDLLALTFGLAFSAFLAYRYATRKQR